MASEIIILFPMCCSESSNNIWNIKQTRIIELPSPPIAANESHITLGDTISAPAQMLTISNGSIIEQFNNISASSYISTINIGYATIILLPSHLLLFQKSVS